MQTKQTISYRGKKQVVNVNSNGNIHYLLAGSTRIAQFNLIKSPTESDDFNITIKSLLINKDLTCEKEFSYIHAFNAILEFITLKYIDEIDNIDNINYDVPYADGIFNDLYRLGFRVNTEHDSYEPYDGYTNHVKSDYAGFKALFLEYKETNTKELLSKILEHPFYKTLKVLTLRDMPASKQFKLTLSDKKIVDLIEFVRSRNAKIEQSIREGKSLQKAYFTEVPMSMDKTQVALLKDKFITVNIESSDDDYDSEAEPAAQEQQEKQEKPEKPEPENKSEEQDNKEDQEKKAEPAKPSTPVAQVTPNNTEVLQKLDKLTTMLDKVMLRLEKLEINQDKIMLGLSKLETANAEAIGTNNKANNSKRSANKNQLTKQEETKEAVKQMLANNGINLPSNPARPRHRRR